MISNKSLNIKNLIVSILLAVTLCFLSIITLPISYAFAEEPAGYTNALEDLCRNSSFNEEDYPVDTTNYSITVLTIAESEDSELFIYTYQPAKYSKATSINIATDLTKQDDLVIKNYDNYFLEFLNSNGVFYKYKVKNLDISKLTNHSYEISAIYCAYDSKIHNETDKISNGNTVDEVAYKVGELFTFTKSSNGTTSLKIEDVDVITITSQYVGFLRYLNGGVQFGKHYKYGVDYYFIAFSTDIPISELLEATVAYSYTNVTSFDSPDYVDCYNSCNCGKDVLHIKTDSCSPVFDNTKVDLTFGETFDYDGSGWFSKDYSFPVIETSTAFLNSSDLEYAYDIGGITVNEDYKIKDESKEKIKKFDWVLRFALFEIQEDVSTGMGNISSYTKTCVGKVAVLRLKFKDNSGNIRNLGVVGNKTTGDLIADNFREVTVELTDSFKVLAMLILGIGLIILLLNVLPILKPIFSAVFKGFGFIIKWVFKIAFFILLFPWNVIFKKRKQK